MNVRRNSGLNPLDVLVFLWLQDVCDYDGKSHKFAIRRTTYFYYVVLRILLKALDLSLN
jgi:hypothetical protein